MSPKTRKIIGWVFTAIIAFPFAMTAFVKLSLNEMAIEQANMLGIAPETFRLMGVVEIMSLIMFIIPRTGIIGTLLLIAYIGGILSADVIHQRPVITGVVMEALVWITAAIRFPELTQRLFKSVGNQASKQLS